MKYNIQMTNKGVCEICNEKKQGMRKCFEENGWFRGDDELIGQFCKKDRLLFMEKHGIDRSIYL